MNGNAIVLKNSENFSIWGVRMRNVRNAARLFSLALLLSLSSPSLADVTCVFNIAGLYLSPDAWVIARFQSGATTKQYWMCTISSNITVNDGYSASRAISAEACKAIYSHLLTARSMGQPFYLYFKGPVDCSTGLPASGSTPNPYPYNFGLSDAP